MLAKILTHGETREQALEKLRVALDERISPGSRPNLEYLRASRATRPWPRVE